MSIGRISTADLSLLLWLSISSESQNNIFGGVGGLLNVEGEELFRHGACTGTLPRQHSSGHLHDRPLAAAAKASKNGSV